MLYLNHKRWKKYLIKILYSIHTHSRMMHRMYIYIYIYQEAEVKMHFRQHAC